MVAVSLARFIAHLVNQQVAHEILGLQLLHLLLENPTDESVEVSIGFTKECGQFLTEVRKSLIYYNGYMVYYNGLRRSVGSS